MTQMGAAQMGAAPTGAAQTGAAQMGAAPTGAAQTGAAPTGAAVLLVDDDVDILEALAMALEAAGYATLAAHNGMEALALLRSGVRPCVILLDLMMPIMSGWAFREEQLRDPELASLPVVVLTGDGKVAQKAASLEVATYLKKPFELDALLAVVRRHHP